MLVPIEQVEVIAPNFKRRLSGVTSTIVVLVPLQRQLGIRIAAFGPGLPDSLPHIVWSDLLRLWRRPATGKRHRVWHARRNVEMIAGIIMRDVLRMPLRLLFTSASQRHHKKLTKWLINRMDAVIATSRKTASFLEVPNQVIMHGIDLSRFTPPETLSDEDVSRRFPGKHVIGCFGRVRHQKGTDLFVDSVINLLPHHPDWVAVVAGRATAEHEGFERGLKQKVAAAGLADRIIFLGEVPFVSPEGGIAAWYRRLSVYVAPSRTEGFGLTPLEAMACDTAVVASDAGAYPELIVEGQTGYTVPAGNQLAMQTAIEYYLRDPALAVRHGKAGLERVREHFPLQREAAAIGEVYKTLLD